MVSIGMFSIRWEMTELNVEKGGYTVLYVDKNYAGANDDNDGLSWAKPKLTIAGALADASPWCKIFIKAGTYTESVTIPYEHVKLIGEIEDGANVAKIEATGGTGIIITAGFCELMNLAVDATNEHAIQATAPGHHFHHLSITLVNTSGSAKYGVWGNDADRIELDHLHIDGSGDDDVVGIFIGNDTIDAMAHDNYITGCGDGIGAGCVAGVCANTGYGIALAETSQRARIHENILIDSCVGIYFYKTGGEDYKGHSILHNQFYENCNYDVYDQYDPEDASDPSGIIIRENFYGYTGWFRDSNGDGRADYVVSCNTNYDKAPLASPRAWETQAKSRSSNT